MRVFRLEAPDPVHIDNAIRPNRYGAFSRHMIGEALYEWMPSPYQDFGIDMWYEKDRKDLFFAFADFGHIVQFVKDIIPNVIVAEYEVVPEYRSHRQVIFDKHNAEFIGEVRLAELTS